MAGADTGAGTDTSTDAGAAAGVAADTNGLGAGQGDAEQGAGDDAGAGTDGAAAAGAGEGVDDTGDDGAAGTAAAARSPDWRDRRIARLTAQLRERDRTPVAAGSEAGAAAPGTTEYNAAVQAAAEVIAANRSFNQRCEAEAQTGRAAFPDFDARVQDLVGLVDMRNPAEAQMYNTFIAAALETGAGAKLIHDLGKDLDRASELLSLSPTKMAVELTKLAMAEPPAAGTSRAPAPITPPRARATSRELIDPRDPNAADGLSTATWMERRNAQIAARGKVRAS